MAQTNIYSILSLSDNPRFQPNGQDHEADRTKMSGQYRTGMSARIYSQKDTQENNISKLREAQPQEQKPDELKQGKAEPFATQPTVSREEFERIQQQLHKPPEQGSSQTGSSLEQVPSAQRSGLNRHYLTSARTRTTQQPNTDGMSSLASVLPKPKPEPTKRTYTQERQVLVDVISDLAREFRDEAKLTESVSRAYNLMGKAHISDINVFTAKMYEARSITKERYWSITRRMPYFFSVLEDVCGLRPKSSTSMARSE
jgi:hypothetical protein